MSNGPTYTYCLQEIRSSSIVTTHVSSFLHLKDEKYGYQCAISLLRNLHYFF